MKAELHFDGSCIPNPGTARSGYILATPNGKIRKAYLLPGIQTNNVAEFVGLLMGLRHALDLGITHLSVFGDSTLVIDAMRDGTDGKGMFHMESLKRQCLVKAAKFTTISFCWIPRVCNSDADSLIDPNYKFCEPLPAGITIPARIEPPKQSMLW